MTFFVEEDETTNPSQMGLLGADTVMAETDAIADLIEQARLLCNEVPPTHGVRRVAPLCCTQVTESSTIKYFEFGAWLNVI